MYPDAVHIDLVLIFRRAVVYRIKKQLTVLSVWILHSHDSDLKQRAHIHITAECICIVFGVICKFAPQLFCLECNIIVSLFHTGDGKIADRIICLEINGPGDSLKNQSV